MDAEIDRLREDFKKVYHSKIQTTKDIEELALKINISNSTLRRFLGKIKSESKSSSVTLNIISNYLGYSSFDDYCKPKNISLLELDALEIFYDSVKGKDILTSERRYNDVNYQYAQKILETNENTKKFIEKFSDKVQLVTGKNNVFSEGSGAAGGLGFAFMSFFNATIYPGSKFMIDYLNLESKIQEADIIITGEGKLDVQSYMGKAPIEIARIAKKFNKKVIFLAGSVIDDELSELNEDDRKLIDASFSIQRKFISLNTAMDKKVAKQNLENTIVQIFNILEFNHG